MTHFGTCFASNNKINIKNFFENNLTYHSGTLILPFAKLKRNYTRGEKQVCEEQTIYNRTGATKEKRKRRSSAHGTMHFERTRKSFINICDIFSMRVGTLLAQLLRGIIASLTLLSFSARDPLLHKLNSPHMIA